jgi:hypothetical protein
MSSAIEAFEILGMQSNQNPDLKMKKNSALGMITSLLIELLLTKISDPLSMYILKH